LIEESIRIPFIVSDPRRASAVNGNQVAALIDVMPTLLDLAGCEVPASVQGQSLAPLLGGRRTVLGRNAAFVETSGMIGIRTPSHLYGVHYNAGAREPRNGRDWFYDLEADPFQLKNLAAADGRPDADRALRGRLLDWDRSTPWHEGGLPDPGPEFADQLLTATRTGVG